MISPLWETLKEEKDKSRECQNRTLLTTAEMKEDSIIIDASDVIELRRMMYLTRMIML